MTAILCAPLHAPTAKQRVNAVITRINSLNTGADKRLLAVGLTEAYSITPSLRTLVEWDLIMESGGKDTRRGQKDNPILFNRNFVRNGGGQLFGCNASTPDELAPERWFTFVVHDTHLIINIHPHAAVQANDGGPNRSDNAKDRVREFQNQMGILVSLLRFGLTSYRTVTVMGDFNCRPVGDWISNPINIMKRLGFRVQMAGPNSICGIASTNRKMDVYSVDGAGTDHKWLVGEW